MPALLTRQSTGPKPLLDLLKERGRILLTGEIGSNGQRFSARSENVFDGLTGCIPAVMIVNGHTPSSRGQCLRHGRTQSSRGASDQCRFFLSRHRRAYLKGLKTMIVKPKREL